MASSAGYNKMFPVSWTELHRDARALAWRLADLGPFKGLVAVSPNLLMGIFYPPGENPYAALVDRVPDGRAGGLFLFIL